MTCTCTTQHDGELIPSGCKEHPGQLYAPDDSWITDPEFHAAIENARTNHRRGKAWKLNDEDAIGPAFTTKQVWVGWASLACVAIVAAGAWLVWG